MTRSEAVAVVRGELTGVVAAVRVGHCAPAVTLSGGIALARVGCAVRGLGLLGMNRMLVVMMG